MAGLRNRKNKKGRGSEREPVTYDYSFNDTMESITADLPGMEELEHPVPNEPEDNSAETASDTPDEALAKFRAQHGYEDTDGSDDQDESEMGNEEDEDKRPRRRSLFSGKRSRLVYE